MSGPDTRPPEESAAHCVDCGRAFNEPVVRRAGQPWPPFCNGCARSVHGIDWDDDPEVSR